MVEGFSDCTISCCMLNDGVQGHLSRLPVPGPVRYMRISWRLRRENSEQEANVHGAGLGSGRLTSSAMPDV